MFWILHAELISSRIIDQNLVDTHLLLRHLVKDLRSKEEVELALMECSLDPTKDL